MSLANRRTGQQIGVPIAAATADDRRQAWLGRALLRHEADRADHRGQRGRRLAQRIHHRPVAHRAVQIRAVGG